MLSHESNTVPDVLCTSSCPRLAVPVLWSERAFVMQAVAQVEAIELSKQEKEGLRNIADASQHMMSITQQELTELKVCCSPACNTCFADIH